MKKPNSVLRLVQTNMMIVVFSLFVVSCSNTYYSSNDISFDPKLKADIEFLASDELEGRETGTEGERKAAEYISLRMFELGLDPKGTEGYYQDFGVKNKDNPHGVDFDATGEITVRNVIGFIDNQAPYTIVIGAHYDHLGHGSFGSLHVEGPAIHNGADDNASGVAGMLYLAEQLKEGHDSHNYLFIGFSGEEHGLWGSNYFTKNPTIPLETVSYMLNMDMIGRLNDKGVLSINGVGTSPSWTAEMKKIKIKGLSTVTTEGGMGASDHTSFYLSDIPALHFFTGQHSDYHKPSDDIEKINHRGIQLVMDYMMSLIQRLSDDGDLVFTKTASNDDQQQRNFKVTLGVMPDYLYDGEGMRIDGVRSERPASNAGIVKGDVVLQMGEYEIKGMEAYMDLLEKFKPGDEIKVIVKRGKKKLEKTVVFD